LAVDAAEAAGLRVPVLSAETQAKLRTILPAAAAVNNPVDMIASATPEHYRACLAALCDEPELDALLVIFIPPLVTPSAEVAQVISEVVSQHEHQLKPIVAVFLDPAANLTAIHAGVRKVPVFNFPESAVGALGAAARYGAWRAQPAGRLVPQEIDRTSLDNILQRNGVGWLPSPEVDQLLRAAGIELLGAITVRSAAAAQIAAKQYEQPVSLKVGEPPILHKSDVGGVLLNIQPDEAAAAYEKLAAQLAARGITLHAASVMPMAKPGVEVLAGITTDPVFGPLVAFGSGGVLVELLDDVVFRVLPLTDRDATAMIQETRAARLLNGYRGTPAADVAALAQVLLKLGALAETASRIVEIDLNPVIIHPAGEGLSLINARIRLS
jgi:acetate---CoA ligase (ADP-forming)